MTTIKDVAKLAGVSSSTVSRTLAGSPLVDEKTKQKVFSAAEKLHYIPNQMARALKGGRSRTIFLIVPSVDPFFQKLITCFEEELRQRGYAMLLGVSNNDPVAEIRCFNTALSFSADGIVFVAGSDNCNHIKALIDYGIPTILINRAWDLGVSCVTNDNRSGAYTATEHLILNGHRRIVCMMRDISIQHFRERYEGCLQAFRDYQIPQSDVYFTSVDSIHDVYAETCRLIKSPNPPTAFFCTSDWLASGIYSGVMSCGLSIPDDISVVGFDNIDDSKYMIPPLTTWEHPIDRISQTAVELLLQQIESESMDWGQKVVIPSRLVERSSVRRLPGAPIGPLNRPGTGPFSQQNS